MSHFQYIKDSAVNEELDSLGFIFQQNQLWLVFLKNLWFDINKNQSTEGSGKGK